MHNCCGPRKFQKYDKKIPKTSYYMLADNFYDIVMRFGIYINVQHKYTETEEFLYQICIGCFRGTPLSDF